MRLFFIEEGQVAGGRVELVGAEARHMARVLRMSPGERCRVSDWRGRAYLVELTAVAPGRVEEELAAPDPPRGLGEFLDATGGVPLKLVAWEGERGRPVGGLLGEGARPGAVALLVVPEGGLTASEVGRARRAGFLPVGLGPRTLRAETAALALLAIVQHRLGDMA